MINRKLRTSSIVSSAVNAPSDNESIASRVYFSRLPLSIETNPVVVKIHPSANHFAYRKDSESRPSGEAHPAMHLVAGLGPLPWANALSSARFPLSKPGNP